ncbi:MAG: hypothetical protein GY885_13645, partial [Phycisphaeraceae bacterium]|nr:hypothetical protein [Phycisphaeraceae bacterium]
MGTPDPMLERAARAMVETDLLLGAALVPLAVRPVEDLAPSATEVTERATERSPARSTSAP